MDFARARGTDWLAALGGLLPLAVALATPRVRGVLIRIALAAAVVALLLTLVRLIVVPDLDLWDFRARGLGDTGSGRTGTSRDWGVFAGLLVAALATAAAAASSTARRGLPGPPPPPA